MKRSDRDRPVVAALNIGSSSAKFALFQRGDRNGDPVRLASGEIDRLGSAHGTFSVVRRGDSVATHRRVARPDLASALPAIFDWIESSDSYPELAGIGHRIVHGGRSFDQPQPVTPRLLRALRTLTPLDPDHLPAELEALAVSRTRFPHLPQVACFDTAFHRTMPPVAQLYALPGRWTTSGVLRYGFHGLSCEYIVHALASLDPAGRTLPRTVVAHLGSGCSMTAIRDGRSVETTMGFTPAGGLVMSTRAGDLDPGVVLYLGRQLRHSPRRLSRLLNQEAGLLGVSGTSADMQVLLRRARSDPRARAAVDLFCYQAGKSLGALASVLGGLDLVVFTGGIGEHSAEIRRRICVFASHLGVRIDARRNVAHRPVISSGNSPVIVRVLPTDEERMIAAHTLRVLSG
jgi:acetate kinase